MVDVVGREVWGVEEFLAGERIFVFYKKVFCGFFLYFFLMVLIVISLVYLVWEMGNYISLDVLSLFFFCFRD